MKSTAIDYATHTWNPIAMRCSPASPGCANCWHLAMADRLLTMPQISAPRKSAYAGGHPLLLAAELTAPERRRKPARIGVQFMGDLFHEKVGVSEIRDVFEEVTPNG